MSSSYLAVGYECNHNCVCCPLTTYDRLHKRLAFDEIESRLNEIDGGKEKHLVLSGGEPMLHPQFKKIVELARDKGFCITVLSNVSLCKDKEFVENLTKYIPKANFEIVTAVHSSYPEVHDGITGVKGSLLDSLEALDNLVSAGISVTVKHIFNKKSIGTLQETIQYLEQHYPPQVGFQFCTMDYCGKAGKNADELFITMDEIKPHIESVLDYLELHSSKKRDVSIIESPLCMTDPYYWKYYRCSGNKLDGYIAPNTDGKSVCFQVESECGSYYPVCESCSVKSLCSGTWRSAYRYYGEKILKPIVAEIIHE